MRQGSGIGPRRGAIFDNHHPIPRVTADIYCSFSHRAVHDHTGGHDQECHHDDHKLSIQRRPDRCAHRCPVGGLELKGIRVWDAFERWARTPGIQTRQVEKPADDDRRTCEDIEYLLKVAVERDIGHRHQRKYHEAGGDQLIGT